MAYLPVTGMELFRKLFLEPISGKIEVIADIKETLKRFSLSFAVYFFTLIQM